MFFQKANGLLSFGNRLAAVLLSGLVIACSDKNEASNDQFAFADEAAFETAVKDFIVNNPEVILESMGRLREKQQRAQNAELEANIARVLNVLEDGSEANVIGNPDGDITLVEFFDFRCGYCRRGFKDIQALVANYPNLKVVHWQYPLLDGDETDISTMAARAAVAAGLQGKYEDFYMAMMGSDEQISPDFILATALGLGLDEETFKADIASDAVIQKVDASLTFGNQIGIGGTPTYILAGNVFPGAVGYDRLAQVIENAKAADPS
ncbi:MAG: DsbA family protein [Pseudomonadota bacterium]